MWAENNNILKYQILTKVIAIIDNYLQPNNRLQGQWIKCLE